MSGMAIRRSRADSLLVQRVYRSYIQAMAIKARGAVPVRGLS